VKNLIIVVYPDRAGRFTVPLKPGDPIPAEQIGGAIGYVLGKCGHPVKASEWIFPGRKPGNCGQEQEN
jgi:hypothetical protein